MYYVLGSTSVEIQVLKLQNEHVGYIHFHFHSSDSKCQILYASSSSLAPEFLEQTK